MQHPLGCSVHRLLALVALAKSLMAHCQLRSACVAASAITTLYALQLHELPQAAGMVRPDLLLFGSFGWAATASEELRDAAQALLSAYLRSFPKPHSPTYATMPSAVTWPPCVLQLAVLAAACPQGVPLSQLQQCLPHIVVAATACVTYPEQVPPELLRVTAAALLDLLLGAAPSVASAAAAHLLAQALGSEHAHLWQPHLGKPAWLLGR